MSGVAEMLARLCPDEVEFKTLREVGEFHRGSGIQKSDFVQSGVGCIHYGEIHTHYGTWAKETKSHVAPSPRLKKADHGDLVIVTTSEDDAAVGKAVAWVGPEPVAVSTDAMIYKHTLDPKFAAYFFQTAQFHAQKHRHITGTKVRRISATGLSAIRVPVPPREVQSAIASALDSFATLDAALATELLAESLARKQQGEHCRTALLASTEDGEWSTLGDISNKVGAGGTPLSTRREYYGGEIPWLRTQEVNYSDILDTNVKITEMGLANSAARWVPANSVIVALSGAGVTRGRVAINRIPLTTNQHCCSLQIDVAKARPRFVFHWLVEHYQDLRVLGQGNRSDLNLGIVKGFPIPVPSLEEQDRVAGLLDRLEALATELATSLPAELAARRQQYEHYRERLFSFPKSVKAEAPGSR